MISLPQPPGWLARIAAVWCACLLAAASAAADSPRTVVFRPLDPVERQFIFRNSGSQEIQQERTRFQDGNSYIVYRFAFRKGTRASLQMRITAQFRVDVSADGNRFDEVAEYTRSHGDLLRIDLTSYTAATGMVYVRVGDAKPDDGWGGKIHEVSVTGFLRNVQVPGPTSVKPIFLPGRTNLYARLPAPQKDVVFFAADGASVPETILFRTLQGLANRKRNELMIGDRWKMLQALREHGWVRNVTVLPDAHALFARYPLKNAVVYDPGLYGSENLAVMIGAMEGLVVAHPSLVGKYGLHVKVDLRDKWKRTIDGYKAVYARYRTRFNRQTVVLAAPSKRPGLYDYAVANRTFTFWIVGGTDANRPGADRWAEEEWFERILSRDFPANIPILGYPQVEPTDGIGENRGVALFSRCAKFLVPADHMTDMSLLSAYPSARGSLAPPHVRMRQLDRSKVYASLVLSDGDNQCLWNGPTAFMFDYMARMRARGAREFAVSYTMGPSIVDLNPFAARLTREYLQEPDSIGGAVSGVGYMYMSSYGDNFGKDRSRVLREFLDLTSKYLGDAGERWDWIMDYGGPGSARLRDYVGLRGCVALMGGYGRETTDPAKTAERVGAMVAFHSVSRMVGVEEVYGDAKLVIDKGVRPLFLNVFVPNWGNDPDRFAWLADKFQKDGVEIVTPEVLADLYNQAHPR